MQGCARLVHKTQQLTKDRLGFGKRSLGLVLSLKPNSLRFFLRIANQGVCLLDCLSHDIAFGDEFFAALFCPGETLAGLLIGPCALRPTLASPPPRRA